MKWTALAVAALAAVAAAQDWPDYAGAGSTHYSPLAGITRATVRNLKVAWEWKTGEAPMPEFKTTPGMFEATPLEIAGVLYLSTPYNRVVALDAETGRERWSYDPKAYEDGQVPNGTGFVHRGVAAWRDSRNGRQAADLHEQPLPADLARRGNRKARRRFRRQRHRQPRGRPPLGDQSQELHQHVAAGGV
jgi:glucose dehydrogenase